MSTHTTEAGDALSVKESIALTLFAGLLTFALTYAAIYLLVLPDTFVAGSMAAVGGLFAFVGTLIGCLATRIGNDELSV